jgi:hypothetical protein
MRKNKMNPICFRCKESLPVAPSDIGEQILDVSNWSKLHGCWPIPGIKGAAIEVRTPLIVGTRIRVTNLDGSTHLEEIVEWEPNTRLRLLMHDFSPPLARVASHFDEIWEFQRMDGETRVTRTFQLHAKSVITWLPLRVIALFLKRAIARHLNEMKQSAVAGNAIRAFAESNQKHGASTAGAPFK